jgi:hypothetical protein
MKKQYRVRVTTYYPSFVVEAENEEQAKELAITMPWPHEDACAFFEVEEDVEDDRDYCQGCGTILRQDESETLCKSCEGLSDDS